MEQQRTDQFQQHKNKQRIKYLDALKLFAIFLVIWGHFLRNYFGGDYWLEPLNRIIYSFHMPLFMTLSGFFASSDITKSLKKLLYRRFRQLLVPTIIFGILICIITYINSGEFYRFGFKGLCSISLMSPFSGVLWYLKCLFINILLYYLFARFTPSAYRSYVLLLSLLFVLILPIFSQEIRHYCTIWKIDYMYPYFLLGIAIKSKYH